MEEKGKPVPSTDSYISALRELRYISDGQFRMLLMHYHAPDRTATASQLAAAAGYSNYRAANSQYGSLASKISKSLRFKPSKDYLSALVTSKKPRDGEWRLTLRGEVARALEFLEWTDGGSFLLPEELDVVAGPLLEGAAFRVTVNAYERNPLARQKCIENYGAICFICKFNFGAVYGQVADGYIHVHHVQPLSEIGEEYKVDPIEDLRPVCPNCHAVLHRRIPPYSIEEVVDFLRG